MDSARTAVLLDTNVLVSAIKSVPRVRDSLRLIVRLLEADLRFVGNEILAEEYLKHARLLPSPTAAGLAASVLGRMEIVHVDERFLRACAPYLDPKNAKDCVHAATCLQLGATLLSNDHDYDAIERAGIIHRMTVSEAIREWLGPRKG